MLAFLHYNSFFLAKGGGCAIIRDWNGLTHSKHPIFPEVLTYKFINRKAWIFPEKQDLGSGIFCLKHFPTKTELTKKSAKLLPEEID